MVTENLSTLKIHKLTQNQYWRELEAGNIEENALYLTPDETIDLTGYATKQQVNAVIETVGTKISAPSVATVGQTIVVKEVDESGKPVSWECADMASGGDEWELISEKITIEEEVASVYFSKDADGKAFSLKKMRIFMYLPPTTGNTKYADYNINGKGSYTNPSGGWSDKNLMCDIETTGAANTADIRWYVLGEALHLATTERVHIVWKMDGLDTIRSFKWALFGCNVMPGTTFEIWGVRA